MGLSTARGRRARARVCIYVCARGQLELARERQTTEPEVKQTVMDGLTGTSEEETGRSQETQDGSIQKIATVRYVTQSRVQHLQFSTHACEPSDLRINGDGDQSIVDILRSNRGDHICLWHRSGHIAM
jgi:hypothetical protein